MIRHGAVMSCTAIAVVLLTSSPVAAHPYPVKPVKIIVGFAPGGGNDFIARFMAQKLTTAHGQQFIVENRPGAGGSIGYEAGIKSVPDGYTLTLISNSYTVNPSFYKLRFDPIADMTPVIQISQGPMLVLVNASLPVKSIAELIAMARAKPGQLNFASSGSGSVGHLATELFLSMAGIKMTHIPYKGTGPALSDTIAGHTNLVFGTTAVTLPHVKSGKLRALAVTTANRIPALPELPTVAEAGVPGYEVTIWYGLIGPKELPSEVLQLINSEVTTLLKLNETAELLQNDGVSPAGGTPEEFLATISREIDVWRKVAHDAGVKVE